MHGRTAVDVGKYLHETRNGGIKVRKHEQQALVEECRASGISAKAWCETKGIDYRRYVTWATNINKENQIGARQWADVTMLKEERPTNEVRLNCGKWTICVECGFNAALLADVLKVVNAIC